MRNITRAFAAASGLLACAALWEAAADLRWANPALLPPLSVILPVLWHLLRSGEFLTPLLSTVALLFGGYAIAAGLGISLGILMGWSRRIDCLLEPLVELIRPIPKPALVPPLFLFLGIGLPTMLTIVALVAFFPILINTAQGVRAIDPVLMNTARTFRASRATILLRVVLPGALPSIMTGLRVSLALGLILAILAEMLAGNGGIGFAVLDLQRSFDTPEMYAWLIILAALGLALTAAFDAIEKRAVPWRAA